MRSLKLIVLFLSVISSSNGNDIKEPDTSDLIYSFDHSTFESSVIIEPENETTGKLVAEIKDDSVQNPEELGMYFEGDIRMPLLSQAQNSLNSLQGKNTRWPSGIVPYVIATTFSTREVSILEWAFREYHRRTCIRFKARSEEVNYIYIGNNRSGCWSVVGRIGGMQKVNFQTPQCLMRKGTALHELMHVVGFIHEQNRYERDDYVNIRTENIDQSMLRNFAKASPEIAHGMGIAYDYASVMHYSPRAFSKNGQPTIQAKMVSAKTKMMGQRRGFTRSDVNKINLMYGCANKNNHGPSDLEAVVTRTLLSKFRPAYQ